MKKFLSLVLALVMTMSLVTISAGAKDFTDDSKINYKEAVDVISAVKVVDGYEDGSFNPTSTLTRGAAAKIICNLILGPTTASALVADAAPYKDVPANSTFAGYIAFCSKEGIISGYADGTFRPGNTLTSYAFMKMLLGALGYDQEVEGYTGANWSINVAKRALNLGLDDGLAEDFNGMKAVTREEACLYALNTLKATMVEYGSKTTVSVGGAEVVLAGSKAEDVWNNAANETIKDDNKMQFAEKYFTDLKKQADRDDFYRPATTWKVKAEKIGTYTDTPDLTYTKGVKNGDIYSDLGSKVAKENVSVYVNGVKKADKAVAIAKGGDVKVGEDGNGVLTEVYYDADAETAEIIQVITYVGEVEKTVKATATKDAYIVLSAKDFRPSTKLTFETDEKFEDDAIVLYTYSEMEGVEKVESVEVAESAEGVVTKVVNKSDDTANNGLTLAGTEYKVSYAKSGELLSNVAVKGEYVVYLDTNGYVIFIEEVENVSSDYALLVNAQDKNDFSANRALLVFADGTDKVVPTAKNYKSGTDTIKYGSVVTYRVDEDGVYTLKPVATTWMTEETNGGLTTGIQDNVHANTTFSMTNDKAGIKIAGGTGTDKVYSYVAKTGNKTESTGAVTVTANSSTVFVVYDKAADEFTSYTGIKNAPTITAAADGDVNAFWYCKNGTMATIMFIVVKNSTVVTDDAHSTIFLSKESASDRIHDVDGDYFEYQAVVNGEIKTVKVDEDLGNGLEGIYANYRIDKHGIITYVAGDDTGVTHGFTNYNGTSALKQYLHAGVGVGKNSKDYTVILDTYTNDYVITMADAADANVYYVDEDGEISTASYSSIVMDDNDLVYAIVEDYMVKTLYIQEVDDGEIPAGPVVSTGYDVSATIAGTAITVNAKATETTATVLDIAIAELQAQGYTNIRATSDTTVSAVKSGVTKDFTITHNKAYKVTFTTADANVVCSPASIYLAEGDKVNVEVTNGYANWDTARTWTVSGVTATCSTATGTGKVQVVPVTMGVIDGDKTATMSWSS